MVIDTHVLLWWVSEPRQLSRKAQRALAAAASPGALVVSAISVLEIATAARRGRLALSMPVAQWLTEVRKLTELRFEPVSVDISVLAGQLGDDMHGDPADRLIVATALTLGVPLMTADTKLRAWRGVKTIW